MAVVHRAYGFLILGFVSGSLKEQPGIGVRVIHLSDLKALALSLSQSFLCSS